MREGAKQIRIVDIIHALLKHRVLIIVMTIIGLTLGIILSVVSFMRGEMTKEYAITSSIAVTSQTAGGLFASNSSNPNSNDIYLAENMVDSVIYLIKSDRTLEAAVDRLSLVGVSTRDIYSNLYLRQYNETQIIEMTLYWRSAEEGVQILSAINAVSPQILIDTLKIGGVSVVNYPSSRYLIGGSVNASMWVYMAVLGLLAGVGFSMLQLLLQPTLVNTHDIEHSFGLEILGEIPHNRKYFSKKRSLLVDDEDGVGEDVRQSFASAAHILSNRLGEEKHQCIYITSAGPNEGKTSTAANLAVQLSDLENRVLLIDFDVRHPSLGNVFLDKVEYSHSLNALYRGETTKEEAITMLSGYLDLLPAILEPKELPLDDAMLSLVKELSQQYDYVLMDTAPVGRVADTMSLNRIAKTAMFVVRFDSTNLNDVRESLEKLDKSGISMVGCIVNGVRRIGREKDSGYYYYRRYGQNHKSSDKHHDKSYYGRSRAEETEFADAEHGKDTHSEPSGEESDRK